MTTLRLGSAFPKDSVNRPFIHSGNQSAVLAVLQAESRSIDWPALETSMPKSSLAPAMRAIVFFGLMGTAVTGLTLGAGLQVPDDQSSTTVALEKGAVERGYNTQIAAVDHSDRARSTAKRAIASPSQQAMAAGPVTHIVR